MRGTFKILLPILVLLLAVGVTGYLIRSKPHLEPVEPQERVWTVALTTVEHADIQPDLKLFGEIVAGREVELRALVAGEVVATGQNWLEGGQIAKGDLLIAIDDFDYLATIDDRAAKLAEAEARLKEIEARQRAQVQALARDRELVELRERELKRAEALASRGASSDKVLDSVRMDLSKQRQTAVVRENDVRAEEARLAQQRAQIQQAEVALRRARRDLENTRLAAPFDGYLWDVQADLGKRLSANDRVGRLVDASRLEAKVTLSDAQFGRLVGDGGLIGRTARVFWQVGGSRFEFAAVVDRTAARIDNASGGVDVFVRLADLDGNTPLRPGAFVEVRLPDRQYRNAVRLPESALYQGGLVYVAADGRLAVRVVEVLARSGNDVLVRGELADGEKVVLTRYPGIGPGQRIVTR